MHRSWIVCVAVVVLVVAGGAAPANTSTCSTWEWINPLPQGNLLSDVAYGNGIFVAVGGAGTVLTTPDGTDPVVGDLGLGPADWVNGLTWTGAQFIAVGSAVLTSPDGFTWTEQASGTSLTDVVWAGGQAVAVGGGGLIQTSPDLFTWTTQVSETTRPLSAVAYGAGLYVIVGHSDNTESVILTSPDGITWTRRTSGTRNALEGVVWNGTRFVAVGQYAYSSDPWILSSADGITWAPETTSATGTFRDVIWSGTQFVALGSYIVTSPDGIAWTVRGGHGLDLWAVAADASGHLMAVGRPGRILTSPDGTAWTDQVSEIGWGQLSDIDWNGTEFVVAAYRILRSLDGFIWTHVQDAPTNMRAVAWGDARWAMVGPVGEIISSPDGITWTTEASGTTEWLRDVAFGGSGFVAVGNSGTVLSSPDGMSWTGQISGVTDGLTAVVWTGQIYVAAGNYGTFITSPDAVTWTDRSTSYTHHVTDLAWNGSLFVATTNTVWVYTSLDGTSWTRHSAPAGGSAVTWNGLEFVALSHSRDPFTSTDGVNWTTESTGAAVGLLGVVPVGTELFVVGESSLIMHRFEGGCDLGDAPDPTYPTLLASNGARHPADSDLYLGAAIDSEADGQPNADATGDDTDPDGDDEDGVVFTSLLIPGELASVEVDASEAGLLSAWIDFNLDGDWDDVGEQIFADQALAAGTNPLGFTVPAGAEAAPMTFARFRVSTAGGLSYDGEAGDGEVEDHKVMIEKLDFGDAPDPTYPTLLVSDGARHVFGGPLYLGTHVDAEIDGLQSVDGLGDDTDNLDDEDGVVFGAYVVIGTMADVDVTSSAAGLLNAWVDFDRDGDWGDAGEQVFSDEPVSVGSNLLGFAIPPGTVPGTLFARFRVDSVGGLLPTGLALDGEVEDYQMEAVQGPDLQIEMASSSNPTPSGDPLTYTVTVTNNGPLDATSVTLTDTLPGELFFVSSTPGSPDCTFSVDTVTCDLGTLSPSDTAQVVIETVLDHPVWGGISNTSSVSASEIDPNPANNTATVDTIIAIFVDGFGSGDLSAWD